METRTLKQVKLYKLLLNDMRYPKVELLDVVAIAIDKQKLIDFYNGEMCKSYRDGENERWSKSFKKGGELEWRNRAFNINELDSLTKAGIQEEWVEEGQLEDIIALKLFIK